MKRLFCIIYIFLLLCINVLAEDSINILVIHSYHSSLPWTVAMNNGLIQAREQYDIRIEYYQEYLDTVRLSEPIDPIIFSDYLQDKYKSVKFDAVLGDSDKASLYIDHYYSSLDDIPHVYYSGYKYEEKKSKYVLTSQYENSINTTLEIIMKQNPDTKEIVIIESPDPSSGYIFNMAGTYLQKYDNVRATMISDFSIDELYEQTAALPSDSVILYSPVIADNTGKFLIPKDVLTRINSVSNVKVYTLWSSLMGKGTGVIGGYMIDGSATASEMVRAALEYLNNGYFSEDYNTLRMLFDWQEIKRHNINVWTIPDDAIVLNKPVSVFITYFSEIMIIIAAVIGVFLIISLAWVQSISKANKKLTNANVEIEKARQMAETLARKDELTGLFNRRAIMPVITYEMNRKKRTNSRVSLMILDIDHFKDVNDTYGHDTGDFVLKEIAKNITILCRNTDFISRWGGEEFLILTPDTSGDHAYVLAEKIRTTIMKAKFQDDETISVSIGIAELQVNEKFELWFQRADSCLYNAKQEGRNRSVLSVENELQGEISPNPNVFTLRLKWQKKYMCGNDTIDTQHHELFYQANILLDLIINNRPKEEILSKLEVLLSHSSTHFSSEEKILRSLGFDGLDQHRQEHKRLLKRLNDDYSNYKDDKIEEYIFLQFVCREMVYNHLIKEDMKFFFLLTT